MGEVKEEKLSCSGGKGNQPQRAIQPVYSCKDFHDRSEGGPWKDIDAES